MNAASEIGPSVARRAQLRIVPDKALHSPEELSYFLRKEIAELQTSGDELLQLTVGIQAAKMAGSTMEERVVTLKIDEDGGRMVNVVGLLKNPIRVPIKKSLIGPVQLLSDEISGTYQQELF